MRPYLGLMANDKITEMQCQMFDRMTLQTIKSLTRHIRVETRCEKKFLCPFQTYPWLSSLFSLLLSSFMPFFGFLRVLSSATIYMLSSWVCFQPIPLSFRKSLFLFPLYFHQILAHVCTRLECKVFSYFYC